MMLTGLMVGHNLGLVSVAARKYRDKVLAHPWGFGYLYATCIVCGMFIGYCIFSIMEVFL